MSKQGLARFSKKIAIVTLFCAAGLLPQTSYSDMLVSPSLPGGGGSVRGIEGFAPTSNAGTFERDLPIEVSPGRNGVQPGLRLHYSSGQGNDIVGLGWQLPVPSIQHHPRRVPDYRQGEAEYYSSEYGELVPVGNSYFRPARAAGFALFLKTNQERWIQWDNRGNRKVFGEENARVESNGTTYRWYLSTELDSTCTGAKDPSCNRIEYLYFTDWERLTSPYPFRNSQVYLQTIRYNFVRGSPLTTLRLTYRPRPDPILSLRAGFETLTDKLLTALEVETEGKMVWEYRFEYEKIGAGTGAFSLLAKVTKLGRNNAPYPETTFRYTDTTKRRFTRMAVDGLPVSELSGKFSPPNYVFMDVDGDGLADIYWHKNGQAWVAYNTTKPGSEKVSFSAPKLFSKDTLGNLDRYATFFADVDGDGTADWVDTAGRPSVRINQGTEWSKPVSGLSFPNFQLKSSDAFLLDVNGDGLVDLFRRTQKQDTCYLNSGNGGGWEKEQVAERGQRPDFDITALSPRTRMGDMNGDGLSDFVLVGHDSIKVWLNRGNCSWAPPYTLNLPKPLIYDLKTQGPEVFYLADVDGDGLEDLVEVSKDGIFWWRNSGEGSLLSSIKLAESPGVVNQLFVGDVNGDGLKDIGYCRLDGRCEFLGIHDDQKPGLLNHIETGLGEDWRITYQPSTAYYNREWKTKVPFVLQVPSEIAHVDHLYQSQVSHFQYRDLYFDRFVRRFNGFGEIDVVQQEGYFEKRVTHPATVTKRNYALGQRTDPTDQVSAALAGRLLKEEQGEQWRGYSYRFQELADCPTCLVLSESQEEQLLRQSGLELGTRRIIQQDAGGNPTGEQLYDRAHREGPLQYSIVRQFATTDPSKMPSAVTDRVQSLLKDETKRGGDGQLLKNVRYSYADFAVGVPSGEDWYLSGTQRLIKKFKYHDVYLKNLATSSDSAGQVILAQKHDESGITLSETTNGEGEKKSFRYDLGTGLPLREEDSNRLVVEHEYTDRGEEKLRVVKHGSRLFGKTEWSRLDGKKGVPTAVTEITQVDAGGKKVTKVTYTSPDGSLLQQVEDGPLGTARTVAGKEYDTRGSLARELLAPIEARSFEYSPANFSQFPNRLFVYDAMDRISSIQFPLARTTDSYQYAVERQGADSVQRRVSVYDRHRNKNRTDRWYDSLDRLTKTTYHLGQGGEDVYSFGYNDADELVDIGFPDESHRKLHWNGRGLLDSIKDPLLGTVGISYDYRGRIATRSWSNRLREAVQYDRADRKIAVIRAEPKLGREEKEVYTYGKTAETFSIGLPETISYVWGKDEFTYSPDGKLSSRKRLFNLPGLTRQFDLHYAFDWLARPRSITVGKHTLRYVSDEHGFLKSIGGVIDKILYDPRLEPVEMQFANGVIEKRSYDSSTLLPKDVSVAGADGLNLREDYEHDEIGNLFKKKRSYSANLQTPQKIWEASYTYDDRDPRYRLLKFDQQNTHESFLYDTVGKRKGEDFKKRFGTVQYDDVGRLQPALHHRELTYNPSSQLEIAQSATVGHGPIKYLYDQDKTVVAKLVEGRVAAIYLDQGLEWRATPDKQKNAEVIFHVYLGSRPVSSVDYQAEKQRYYHSDHMGSTILVTDESKHPIHETAYRPYGEILYQQTGPADKSFATEFAFAGARYDADTLLYRLGVRHYDPAMGQFLTPDPMALEEPLKLTLDPVQLFPYQYARDNPLSYVDTTGRAAQLVGAAIAGTVEFGLQTALLSMQAYSGHSVTWGEAGTAAAQVGLSAAAGATVAGIGVRFASWSKTAYELGTLSKMAVMASNVAVNAVAGGTVSAIAGTGANLLEGRPSTHNWQRNFAGGFFMGGAASGIGLYGSFLSKNSAVSHSKPFQFALTNQMDFFPEQFSNSMGKWDAVGFTVGAIAEKILGNAGTREPHNK